MLKYSNDEVSKFSYKKISEYFYEILLRENITLLDDGRYSYNEYQMVTKSSDDNIESVIESNFDLYLENAKLNEKLENKNKEIDFLKKKLSNTDYQIIKNLENHALGLTLPYDYSFLISSRQAIRDEINNLQNNKNDSDLELNQLKERKINEMCAICQTTITNGIDFNDEHFRLNTTDQINLTSLYSLAQMGQSVPYHADGKVCRIFTPEEMISLVQQATSWVTYHTTYYNLLKHQILEMETIEEINSAQYGMDLKKEYQAVIDLITKK